MVDDSSAQFVGSVRPSRIQIMPGHPTRGSSPQACRGTIHCVLPSNGPDDRFGNRPADPQAFGRPPAGRPGRGDRPGPGSSGTATDRRPGRGPDPPPGGDRPANNGRPSSGGRGGPRGRGRKPSGETGPPPAPVRRILSITIAGFSLLLAFGLALGSQATQTGYTVVIFSAQVLFVLAWTVASRPPSPWVVAIVGVLTAAGTTAAVNYPTQASLAPLGYVIAGGFIGAIVGQLALRGGRAGVTESLGVTMVVVVGVTAFSAYGVLARRPLGAQVLLASLAAIGVGLAVARLCDVVAPSPRIASHVPRGSTGIVAGAMAGTAAAAVAGVLVDGLTTLQGAIAGMVAVLVAVVVDLGTGYAEAGRHLEGEVPFMWIARHMQGPLGAFAFAAPVSYVVGVILR